MHRGNVFFARGPPPSLGRTERDINVTALQQRRGRTIGAVSSIVLRHLENNLLLMIESGKRIDNIVLKISPAADIRHITSIHTKFGLLPVELGVYIPKGYAYLIERRVTPGGIGFKWVGKRNSQSASVGEREPTG